MSARDINDAGVKTFLHEAEDLLEQVEIAAIALEDRPDDEEIINQLFRSLHTLKGSGAMVGFDAVSAFTHGVETALDQVRCGRTQSDPQLVGLLLAAKDHVQVLLDATIAGSVGRDTAGERLIGELTARCSGTTLESARLPRVELSPAAAVSCAVHPAPSSAGPPNVDDLDDLFIVVEPTGVRYESRTGDSSTAARDSEPASRAVPLASLRALASARPEREAIPLRLSIPSARLDRLVTLVDSLVVNQARLSQAFAPKAPPGWTGLIDAMNRLGSELQNSVVARPHSRVSANAMSEPVSSAAVPFSTAAHDGSPAGVEPPPTLSIIDGLLVEVADLRLIIPLDLVVESVVLLQTERRANLGRDVATVRGASVPYLVLRESLGLPKNDSEFEKLVLVLIEGDRLGVVVDRVVGRLSCGAGLGATHSRALTHDLVKTRRAAAG